MQRVAIIGGGPAGLMAAHVLADHASVDLYDQGRTVGRKFLVAGDGGLNITNSLAGEALVRQYSPANRMQPALQAFGSTELRSWLGSRGIPTFAGTSGRVFPQRGIRPAEVLKTIIAALKARGAHIHTEHRFVGFNDAVRPILAHGSGRSVVQADAYLFAMGGASWPKTGSTGEWAAPFRSVGIQVDEFKASNCGVETFMSAPLLVHAGKPLKNIAVSCGSRKVRGELMVTEYGLEGNAIYPLIAEVRADLISNGTAEVIIDLKPDLSEERIGEKLRHAAWKERMAALRLDRVAVALFKAFTPVDRFLDGRTFAHDLKHVRIPISALRPIEEAISTVGGIAMDEVDEDLALKQYPHLFVAGEMLDWDAPTGGFLLQGAFATGRWAAQGIAKRLGLTEKV